MRQDAGFCVWAHILFSMGIYPQTTQKRLYAKKKQVNIDLDLFQFFCHFVTNEVLSSMRFHINCLF